MSFAQTLPDSRPDYDLRVSGRCKRVIIKITPLGKIEVVIPTGFDPARIPEILQQRQHWLDTHLGKLQARWAKAPDEHDLRPELIHLRALGRRWQVGYRSWSGRQVRLKEKGQHLQLHYPQAVEADTLNSRRLQKWVNEQARQHLLPWLAQTADELALPYQRACIRAQKTRWGSCSSNRVINLNRNLLFLPPQLVRYLFVHELSHTRHMNHSRQFWQQVARAEPDYRRLDAELGQAASYLPRWIHV
ncbi:protein of unknown function DUF45 [hydrothermal vent metagenome]|uniref:YgjP-like metallopeptidase domain-containing protein n=1 Tax=hydrothermal vent metagenome TaxID=652676 RepID=A0A3B1BYV3_9ZZZZ